MTKEEIVKLAIENNLVVEVYHMLHAVVIAQFSDSVRKARERDATLKVVKKLADKNRLEGIKAVLKEDEQW